MKAMPLATTLLALACFAVADDKVAVTGSAPHTVRAGKTFSVKVKLDVPAGFHVYGPGFTGIGVPMTFEISGGKGFKLGKLTKPGGELMGTPTISVPLTASKTRGKAHFKLVVHYQECNDRVCYPATSANVIVNTTVK